MRISELKEEYFHWIIQLVGTLDCLAYTKCLRCLHGIEFTYIIDMDGNRATDGVGLRWRFHEQGYPYLDDGPCSVLEMMVALALRCEESIMADRDLGNRTGVWFWGMIINLGLGAMHDRQFDEDYVVDIITRFLNREYNPDGTGGLFTIEGCDHDLRDVEIWYQMCWYLNKFI